jgi:hypothetical protein
MFFLGLAGLLFSGYLSAIKLFTSTCAFNEPCPYFLGYPACWFGFGMFLIIFSFALLGLLKVIFEKVMSKIITLVSALGILFAGYFTIPEIGKLLSGAQTGYSLGLPTCAYGLIFYILIFIFSLWYLKTSRNPNN